jgi:hypothetical protein
MEKHRYRLERPGNEPLAPHVYSIICKMPQWLFTERLAVNYDKQTKIESVEFVTRKPLDKVDKMRNIDLSELVLSELTL